MSAATGTILTIAALGATTGVSLYGAHKQSEAAKTAAGQQEQSAQQALALQKQMYEQTRTDLAPYREQGGQGLTALSSFLGMPATSTAAPPGPSAAAPPTGARPPTLGTPVGTAVPRGTATGAPLSQLAGGSAYAPAPAMGAPGDFVQMRSPSGQLGRVPRARMAEAIAAGGQVVQ